jgi:hypothetical protein
MNYAYLFEKYCKPDHEKVKVIVHDRTYDGLEVHGMDKPSRVQFESFQEMEDRESQREGFLQKEEQSLIQLRQEQARVEAKRKSVSVEERIRESWNEITASVLKLRSEAVEAQESLKAKNTVLECWYEIEKAQEMINHEAMQYLAETDWYVTRKLENGLEIPQEVFEKRAEARNRIDRGHLVFKRADELRRKEMPSKEEIKAAILQGGKELERIKSICKEISLKYAKPSRR